MSSSPAPTELQFRVTGMTCAGCAASVQAAIEGEAGVESASVSVTEGLATVTGPGVAPDRLVEVIEGRGFGATVVSAGADPAELRSEIEVEQLRSERAWCRRAAIALTVWVPLEVMHWTLTAAWVPWVMAIGATIVIGTAGAGFYASAFRAARRRTTNMDTLIAIGATTAYVYSLVRLLWDLGAPMYFGESAALLGIISLGHWIEARAAARAGSAVRDLLELQPDEARRLDDHGHLQLIPVAEIQPGDRLRVRPFERIPVDGAVVEGESEVDESVVTGEPLPVRRIPGDTVIAGALNTEGTLIIQAATDGRNTTLARIATLVQRAQTSKAGVQRLADRICAVFVPAVLSIATATVLGWWILRGDLTMGLVSAVTVLIISCPCALGLATPMAVMVGTGSASRRGILFRNAAAIERAGRAERVVFDKTGTLTTGHPIVARIDIADESVDPDRLLTLAASVEAISEHPIARAIVNAATERGLELRPVSAFRAMPGHGVRADVGDDTIEVRRHERASCVVLINGEEVGTLSITDGPRPDAAMAIRRLRLQGLDVRMISGDRRGPSEAIGEEVGIGANEIEAEATPESKMNLVAALGANTVMVGDGVNDAAALAEADLGIAISSGTNIAIESADVIIPGARVEAVPDTIDIARRTLRCIKQNLAFAFLYNGAAIPAAAFGLLGEHGPLIAAIAMACSDLTVIGNALRLKWTLRGRT